MFSRESTPRSLPGRAAAVNIAFMGKKLATFEERLEQALTGAGLTNATFASQLGPNGQQLLHNWRKRGRIGAGSAAAVRKILPAVSMEWLNDGVGEEATVSKVRPIDAWDGNDPLPQGYETIQRIELYLSAGTGLNNGDEPQEMTPNVFRSDFLKRMGWSPKTHFCMYVKGDSMDPTMVDGSMVVVDTTQKEPKSGRSAVYAIKVDGDPRLKRLHRLPDGTIRVTSDNTNSRDYPAFDVGPESRHSLEIIGKVVFYQTVFEG